MAGPARIVCRHVQGLATQVIKENIRMLQFNHAYSKYAKRAGVTAIVLVLGVLIFGGYTASFPKPGGALPAAPNKDKDQVFTQVYKHTYDEVFQASQETIERLGLFITDKDKDKGTISGNGVYQQMTRVGPTNLKTTLAIHIETVSAKPETRVTINAHMEGMVGRSWEKDFKQTFLREVQKVLVTYH
jgi:hypothetical protein